MLNLGYLVLLTHKNHVSPYLSNFKYLRLLKVSPNFGDSLFRMHFDINSSVFSFHTNPTCKISVFQVHLVGVIHEVMTFPIFISPSNSFRMVKLKYVSHLGFLNDVTP